MTLGLGYIMEMKSTCIRTILSLGLFSSYTVLLFILIMDSTLCFINSKYDYLPKARPVRAAVSVDGDKAVSVQVVSYNNEEIGQNCEEFDSCNDRHGFEAIRALHRQLDDDANGNVDITESDEFLRDELQYENGYERQKGFHGNDKHISVDELWRAWKQSEVHNWTVDEAIEWLIQSVELPQYASAFQENSVDGTALPRIALNNMQFLSNILGIKDSIHKQKISLKAMDIVLFGVPRHHNYKKDVLLILSLVIAVSGCWFAYIQHKSGQAHLKKMLRDMESLQKAEEALQVLQYELDKAREEQMSVAMEKRNLERRLKDERKTQVTSQVVRSPSLPGGDDQESLNQLEEEIRFLKDELRRTETYAWKPPSSLQHWLQLTHELELKHYNAKKSASEKQLAEAKEGCDKVRKKRSSFLGTFRIAHGSVIDDVDSWILQARTALSEMTNDLQERLQRWKQIEQLCGFPIVHNSGLAQLEALLHGAVSNGTTIAHSFSSGSVVSISPLSCLDYSEQHSLTSTTHPANISPSPSSESRLDCSLHQSEELATDDEMNNQELDVFKESDCNEQNKSRPSFEIGESPITDGLSRSSPRGQMFKSYSHDHQSPPREVVSLSRSESSLECSAANNSSLGRRIKSGHFLGSFGTLPSDGNSSLPDDDNQKEKKNRSFLKKLKKKKPKVL